MQLKQLLRFAFSLSILGLLMYSCSKDSVGDPTPSTMDNEDDDDMEMPDTSAAVIWDGPLLSFSKASGADPTDAQNQDRLTDNVWITRGNNGGQIYNAKSENSANKASSPEGTEWAEGALEDWEKLDFKPFRSAVGQPKNVEGRNLVLHLIEDNIYLRVRFTSWSQGKAGGFAYERSTPQ